MSERSRCVPGLAAKEPQPLHARVRSHRLNFSQSTRRNAVRQSSWLTHRLAPSGQPAIAAAGSALRPRKGCHLLSHRFVIGMRHAVAHLAHPPHVAASGIRRRLNSSESPRRRLHPHPPTRPQPAVARLPARLKAVREPHDQRVAHDVVLRLGAATSASVARASRSVGAPVPVAYPCSKPPEQRKTVGPRSPRHGP